MLKGVEMALTDEQFLEMSSKIRVIGHSPNVAKEMVEAYEANGGNHADFLHDQEQQRLKARYAHIIHD